VGQQKRIALDFAMVSEGFFRLSEGSDTLRIGSRVI
jgi:hypothetical protein